MDFLSTHKTDFDNQKTVISTILELFKSCIFTHMLVNKEDLYANDKINTDEIRSRKDK